MRRIAAIAGLVLFFGLSAATPQKLEHFFLPQAGTTWSATADSSARGDFFPHHVGDRWRYWHSAYGYQITVVTKDSIGADSSRYLFYDNNSAPKFHIDTAGRVFREPSFPTTAPLYRFDADSGFAWFNPSNGIWAWVAQVETAIVFSQPTIVKVFRYGYGNPDSGFFNQALEEHHMAQGFGRVYWDGEPAWVEMLQGCVIAGDTFGIVTSTEVDEAELPTSFLLKQNYPNPFNPATTIELSVPSAGEVRLTIYNVVGQQLALLYEGRLTAGTHRFRWSAVDLATGAYFCRLEGGGKGRIIKMLFMK